ncbi:MAG: AtpZ/AtpI family protein [Candidatus Saccharimonadales bacterium]
MEKSKAAPTPRSSRAVFVIAALDMSWRLAIAVLVPVIGGFELDKHLNTTPALTIIGFLLAMAGLFFILKSTVAKADEKFKARDPK